MAAGVGATVKIPSPGRIENAKKVAESGPAMQCFPVYDNRNG
jgi:hypothetical protein